MSTDKLAQFLTGQDYLDAAKAAFAVAEDDGTSWQEAQAWAATAQAAAAIVQAEQLKRIADLLDQSMSKGTDYQGNDMDDVTPY